MKKPNGYWTKERCTTEALLFETKSDFKKSSRSAFGSARKNGWLEEISSHMVPRKKPDGYWTKEVCAKEALRYKTRGELQKKSSSAYLNISRNGWMDELCGHMNNKKPYETKENCHYQALKFGSRSEFKKNCSSAYQSARMNGWLDSVCGHMKIHGNWDKKKCIDASLKYSTKKAFREECSPAYSYAYNNGFLDEICAHMQSVKKPVGYWTKARCAEAAKKYQIRSEFYSKHVVAFKTAEKNGWLDTICDHMKQNKPPGYWTKNRCAEEALKYGSRKIFQTSCESAYTKARRNGWLDEVCAHMERKIKPSGYWSKKRCCLEAQKYKSRLEFQKGNESAYTSARKNKWLESACRHMSEKSKPNGHWTKQACLDEALKYDTRTDFSVKSNGAYKVALKNKWVDEICTHMVPIGNLYMRAIYLVINMRLNKVYIGLTSNIERRKAEHAKGSRTKSTQIISEKDTDFIQLSHYVSVEKAAVLEFQFIESYEELGFEVLNDKSRIGGLGGSRLKWTKNLLQEEALKYNTRYEFQKKSRGAHASAQRQGLLDEICKHMSVAKR